MLPARSLPLHTILMHQGTFGCYGNKFGGPERFQGGAWGWTRKTLYLRTADDTMLPIDRATGAIGREQAWLWEGWSAIYEDTAYVRDWVTGHICARRLEDQ